MDIDQKWLSETAGWKALKEAKGIVKSDAVIGVQRKGDNFFGTVGFGKTRKYPKVQIHSKFDISTACTCFEAKRNGTFCQHAVAIILYWLENGDTSEKSEKSNPATSEPSLVEKREDVKTPAIEARLQILFPPNLIEIWEKRKMLPLHIVVKPESENTLHQKALQLLSHISSDFLTSGGMLQAREAEASVLLRTLSGSDGVFQGKQQLRIAENSLRPDVNIQEGSQDGHLHLVVDLPPNLSWLSIGPVVWGVNSEENLLIEGPNIKGLGVTESFLDDGEIELSEENLIKNLELWDERFRVDWGRAESIFSIQEGLPVFELEISGGSKKLVAKLFAQYEGGPKVLCNSVSSDSWVGFPFRSDKTWFTRNLVEEEQGEGRIKLRGFHGDCSHLVLEGDDHVAEFLAIHLEDLENEWTVKLASNIHAYRSNLEPLRPNLEIAEGRRGEDWLAFDFDFRSAGGTELSREQVRRLLQQGKTRIRGKSGKELVLSRNDFEEIESVLLDTNPEQKNGRLEARREHSFYLRNKYKKDTSSLVSSDFKLNLIDTEISRLRPYQAEGLNWLVGRCNEAGGAVLADDMGLGKTIQTLSVIHHFRGSGKPSLVICPKSLLGNWKTEVEKFFPETKLLTYHGPKRKGLLGQFEQTDLIISTYEIVFRDLAELNKIGFQVVALDEASLIRNADTESAKAVMKLDRQYSLALTGTPVENSVRDLWTIFQFSIPGYLGASSDFKLRYEKALQGNDRPDPQTAKRLKERVEPFMLRRTKSEVAKDLPKKIEILEYCDLSGPQQAVYRDLLEKGDDLIREFSSKNGQQAARMQVLTLLLRLRQACCDPRLLGLGEPDSTSEVSGKLTRLLELVDSGKSGGHKMLVFSQFTGMLQLISLALTERGINFCYLDGSTSNRQAQIDRFQSKDGPPVFLISLKAGGYGLNLTAADTVVHFDPWWNPAVEAQATDRAHRIGQTKPVTVYKLVTKNTVEEKIINLQSKKRAVINQTLGEHTPLMRGLDDQDLTNLLQ